MPEEPIIIQMNISHYREMLGLDLGQAKRSVVEQLLARAKADLTLAVAARGRA